MAVAERYDGDLAVATATGATPDEAWAAVSGEIAASRVSTLRRVRIASAR